MTLDLDGHLIIARAQGEGAASIMLRSMLRAAMSTWRIPPTTRSTPPILLPGKLPSPRRVKRGGRRAGEVYESQPASTSNCGENTIGVLAPAGVRRWPKDRCLGARPNGSAYDAPRRLVLAADVGDPAVPRSCTRCSMVDLDRGKTRPSIEVPGRTRWTASHLEAEALTLHHASLGIVVVDARNPDRVARTAWPCPPTARTASTSIQRRAVVPRLR